MTALHRPFPLFVPVTLAETALFLVLFGPDGYDIFLHTLANKDMNHALLVPPIAAYLIYEKWPLIDHLTDKPRWTGIVLLAAALALFGLGIAVESRFIIAGAVWSAGVAILWLHRGKDAVKALSFPILFALAAMPFPDSVYRSMVNILATISGTIAVTAGRWMGMTLYYEASRIDAGENLFFIADACSGIRYFIPMGLLCILIAHYAVDTWGKRIVVVLLGLAAVVMANGLRITLAFDMADRFGIDTAMGFFHGISGWAIFMISLALVVGATRMLRPRFRKPPQEWDPKTPRADATGASGNGKAAAVPIPHVACLVIMTISVALRHGVFTHPGP